MLTFSKQYRPHPDCSITDGFRRALLQRSRFVTLWSTSFTSKCERYHPQTGLSRILGRYRWACRCAKRLSETRKGGSKGEMGICQVDNLNSFIAQSLKSKVINQMHYWVRVLWSSFLYFLTQPNVTHQSKELYLRHIAAIRALQPCNKFARAENLPAGLIRKRKSPASNAVWR